MREGARYGAYWGLAVGLFAGAVVKGKPTDRDEDFRRTRVAVTIAQYGFLTGALVGAIRPGHRWRVIGVPAAQLAAAGVGTETAPVSAADQPAPAVETPAATRAHATSVETTLGANLPQYFGSQFPGLSLSVALSRAIAKNKGMGLVGEVDASYLRLGVMGGPRVYVSDGPLFAKSTMATFFTQVLIGRVFGGESYVLSSTGGPVIQPGVGLHLGGRARVFHLQGDYRIVRGGFLYDERVPGQHIGRATGPRVLFGVTFRARSEERPLVSP